MERRHSPVFRSLNRPLTLMGAERKLFFFALMMGAGVFNLLHTFFGGILMFCLLYAFAPPGYQDRPSDAAVRPQFRQTPRAVRPGQVYSDRSPEGAPCLSSNELSR